MLGGDGGVGCGPGAPGSHCVFRNRKAGGRACGGGCGNRSSCWRLSLGSLIVDSAVAAHEGAPTVETESAEGRRRGRRAWSRSQAGT